MGDSMQMIKELSLLYEKHEELAIKRKETSIELDNLNKEYLSIDQKIGALKEDLGITEKKNRSQQKNKIDVSWDTEKVKKDLLVLLKGTEEEFTARGLADMLQEFDSDSYAKINKNQDRKLISDISNSLKAFINKDLVLRNKKDHSSTWHYSYKEDNYDNHNNYPTEDDDLPF